MGITRLGNSLQQVQDEGPTIWFEPKVYTREDPRHTVEGLLQNLQLKEECPDRLAHYDIVVAHMNYYDRLYTQISKKRAMRDALRSDLSDLIVERAKVKEAVRKLVNPDTVKDRQRQLEVMDKKVDKLRNGRLKVEGELSDLRAIEDRVNKIGVLVKKLLGIRAEVEGEV